MVEVTPVDAPKVAQRRTTDARNAPIIYCDGASGLGFLNGIVTITLGTSIQVAMEGTNVEMQNVIVAHLRMNAEAAVSIRTAIEKALLMGTPVQGEAN